MNLTHHQRIFKRTWIEHQQIRLLLVEIKAALGQWIPERTQKNIQVREIGSMKLSRRLFGLLNQLYKRFSYEGANGEVAITLACDRYLHSDVSCLASRWKKLDRELRNLLEVYAKCDEPNKQLQYLREVFPDLAGEIARYLPDKMDALRRSLVNVRQLVSASV